MLELRPSCENCAALLPPQSTDAMICSFECTFCRNCVEQILHNVCPNCGGGFEKRPVRPAEKLERYPAQTAATVKPVNVTAFTPLLERMRFIVPELR
ncbi:MAG: DUF1272 domain-containing protein [Bacteroidia bacterium]